MGCSPSRNSSSSDDDLFRGRHSYAHILSEVCGGSGGVEGQTATTYGDANAAPDGKSIDRDEFTTLDRESNIPAVRATIRGVLEYRFARSITPFGRARRAVRSDRRRGLFKLALTFFHAFTKKLPRNSWSGVPASQHLDGMEHQPWSTLQLFDLTSWLSCQWACEKSS